VRIAPGAVVLVTAGSREEAEGIARALVAERLAACASLVAPVTSIYRWQGAVERAEEVLLLIKTRRALVARLEARVRALHSYEVPEVIALPIVAGARPYLAWLAGATAGAAGEPAGLRGRSPGRGRARRRRTARARTARAAATARSRRARRRSS
jgi:periplasmic divalent cation tolerance protein